MADIKISELTELINAVDNDVLIINDVSTGNTKKITRENLLSHITKNVVDSADGAVLDGDFKVANEIIAGGDISTSGDISFGSLTDYVNNVTVLSFSDSVNAILNYDSSVATNKALRDYVTTYGGGGGGGISVLDSGGSKTTLYPLMVVNKISSSDSARWDSAFAFNSLTNTLTLGGNFIPLLDSVYDLGSSSKKWRDLYLSGSTIRLGEKIIREQGSQLVVNSTVSASGFVGDGSGLTGLPSGDNGVSIANIAIYKRSASLPATPTGGSYDFGNKTLSVPATWAASPPADNGNPLYISTVVASANSPVAVDEVLDWTVPVIFANSPANGSNGSNGVSIANLTVYKRSGTLPATPSGGSYNFGTSVFTVPAGWSSTPPATDGNPLYVSNTVAVASSPTDTDDTLTWTSPVVLLPVPVDGNDGSSFAQLTVYIRSASTPSTPTGGSFSFDTRTITPPSGWSVTVPVGANTLYVSNAVASVVGSTGTDNTLTWSTPATASAGENGTNGVSTYQATIYKRAASTPTTADSGSFDFGLNILYPPQGWSGSIPDGTDPIYASNFQFRITGDVGIDSVVPDTWTTPYLYGTSNVDGADGLSTFAFSVYRRTDSASPATPTGGSYNFGTNTVTPPTGPTIPWYEDIPVTNGKPLWASRTVASVQGVTGIDNTLTWASPVKILQDGATGATGANARSVTLTPSSQVIRYDVDGNETDTLTFTATTENFTGSVTYKFYVGATLQTTGVAGNVFTLQDADEPVADSTRVIKVEAYEDLVLKATDVVTVYGIKNGADAVYGYLSNEAHVEPADSAGALTTSLSDAGGTFNVYVGTTDRTGNANVTYSVVSETGVDVSIGSNGVYTANSMSANSGTATFRAVVGSAIIPGSASNITIDRVYTISKSLQGTKGNTGNNGSNGTNGDNGLRTASGYIYYQTTSANSPTGGSAVSTASVTIDWSTLLLSGGVITAGTWAQTPPTFAVANSNKYWYAYYRVVETVAGGAYTVYFSIPYQAQNFTGLVTFTGTNTLTDGTNTTTALVASDLGSSGTTTIDGGRITTGSIAASLGITTNGSFELTGTNSKIYSGKTSFSDATAGFFLGRDATVPKFKIGDGSKSLSWDGTTLTVVGDVIATGNLQAGSVSTNKIGNNQITDIDYVKRTSSVICVQDVTTDVIESNQLVVPDVDGSGTAVPVIITYYVQHAALAANNMQFIIRRTRVSATGSVSAEVSRFNTSLANCFQGSGYSFAVKDSVIPGTYTWKHQVDMTGAGSNRTIVDAAIIVQVLKK